MYVSCLCTFLLYTKILPPSVQDGSIFENDTMLPLFFYLHVYVFFSKVADKCVRELFDTVTCLP